MAKRNTKGYRVAKAFEVADGNIHAVVITPSGSTLTVFVPDWADKEDIKQEAARLQELNEARNNPKPIAALEDPE